MRAPGPLCPALQSETLVGDAPFGHLAVALDNFTAGDCITISQAVIAWGGTCLEQLTLSFPYPVTSDGTRRSVTQSFDTDARFDYRPPGWAPRSDVTTIHFACMKDGVASFHGPTVMSGFAENAGMSPLTDTSFRRALFGADPIGPLPHTTEGWTTEHLPWSDPANQEKPRRRTPSDGVRRLRGEGRARGRLIGGCAEVLEMLKATALWPPPEYWDGAILFYETSEEAPSDTLVLRWLRNFAAQGILSRLSGLLLARPGGDMDEARREAQKAAVLRALDEADLVDLPVLADLDPVGDTDRLADFRAHFIEADHGHGSMS